MSGYNGMIALQDETYGNYRRWGGVHEVYKCSARVQKANDSVKPENAMRKEPGRRSRQIALGTSETAGIVPGSHREWRMYKSERPSRRIEAQSRHLPEKVCLEEDGGERWQKDVEAR